MNAVIVHMGEKYLSYITDSIEQFFLFNKTSKLYCLVDHNFQELQDLRKTYNNLEIVLSSSLKKSFSHWFFLKFNRNAYNTWRSGFWRYVIERFFLLEDFLRETGETNILHFECDNLIYQDISQYSEYFYSLKKIGLIIDSNTRCIPSIMFIPNAQSIAAFCRFYNLQFTLRPYISSVNSNDMIAFAKFRNRYPFKCITLPIVLPQYASENTLTSEKIPVTEPNLFYEEFKNTQCVFDAAAYGQYIGGRDARNLETPDTINASYINEHSVCNPLIAPVTWEKDKLKLLKPFVEYPKGTLYPLFNLHIHSKELYKYRSDKVIL